MLIAQQGAKPEEESGMFTKKYVGPVNCASCEKNITNLLGERVDYHAWKRLPFREPSERIARVSTFVIDCRLTSFYSANLKRSMDVFGHEYPMLKLPTSFLLSSFLFYIVWSRLLQDLDNDEAK